MRMSNFTFQLLSVAGTDLLIDFHRCCLEKSLNGLLLHEPYAEMAVLADGGLEK